MMSRTKRFAGLFLLGAMLAACAGTAVRAPGPVEEVGPDSVWQVGMETLRTAMAEHCDEEAPGGIDKCFLNVMEILGAGPAAVRFSTCLDSAAYLYAFQQAGPVDVGWVHHPFRENERYGCILLNGSPSSVDVDRLEYMPLKALGRDVRYQGLKEAFPDVSVRPGDRAGPGHVAVEDLADGGRRFVVGYKLRNGCHACELVGSVDFAFDFDGEGNFLQSRPFAMGAVLHTVAGRSVTLTLETGPEESGGWQMVRLPPPESLRLESKAGGPGPETWTFLAGNPGPILIDFRRISQEPEAAFPNARASFLVVVHEDEEDLESALGDVFGPVINRRLDEAGSPRAGKVELHIKGVHRDLARVDIRPRNPAGDEWAMVYLKRRKGEWGVLGMGRSFGDSFYTSNGIPPELQGPVDKEAPYVPLPVEYCNDLLNALSTSLGLEGELEESAPFFDYSALSHGEGCRITLRGTGDIVPGLVEAAGAVRSVLEDQGYIEDPAYAADGPLGTSTGYKKEESLMLVRVVVEPAEEVGLLSNRPLSINELLPEERLYTIMLDGAHRKPDDSP
ncbi:MAG: hypothetical protein R6V25_12095 [Desulfatiglandales bacterium]